MFGFFKKDKDQGTERTPISDNHRNDVWYVGCEDCNLSGLTETEKDEEVEDCPRCDSRNIYRKKM